MNYKNILITGGAGFIGSHLTDKLISLGCGVRILDNLEPQVHQGKTPKYLNKKAEFIKGDVRDFDFFKKTLDGIDAVFHFAGAVGVGQSQYQIKRYIDVTVGGTANLLDIIINQDRRINKIIVAASMSSYGEGLYNCEKCGKVRPPLRDEEHLKNKGWEPKCPHCGGNLNPVSTGEEAVVSFLSFSFSSMSFLLF